MRKFQKSRPARLAATALAVGVFASLAGVGYAAGLVPFAHTSPTAAQYPTSKVTICHHTHSQKNPFVTITVSEHALPAHLGHHGDTVGPCPTGTTGATGPAGTVIVAGKLAHKGKAKGHDKGSDTAAQAGVQSHGQGHAFGHSSTHGKGQGHGHANGHSSTHGQGKGHGNHGQGHGHDNSQSHGHGQGHGQGHGPSGTHGNSGGNGKGHKH
jgi:hypothetical protein